MSRPLCGVVMAAFKRRALLERSLICYQNQDFPNDRFEIVVVEDHGNDGTRELVLDWSATTKIKATVLTVAPKPGEWVDCAWCLNAGIRASSGQHIILTHPEVLPGKRSVAACVEALQRWELGNRHSDSTVNPNGIGLYACCTPYYLSPRDQGRIDTVDWRTKGASAVTDIADFYDEGPGGNLDYRHNVTEKVGTPGFRIREWSSWVFGGHSRETWKRLGGFGPITTRWGSCDISWMHRRHTLGIPNHTCVGSDVMCAHMNHDLPGDVPTPRDMEAWVQELRGHDLDTPSKLVYPAVDYI